MITIHAPADVIWQVISGCGGVGGDVRLEQPPVPYSTSSLPARRVCQGLETTPLASFSMPVTINRSEIT